MVQYTANLRVPIPDFLAEPWHEELTSSIRALDAAIYNALIAQNVSLWVNNHAYAIGDIVIGPEDGRMYTAGVTHTSPVVPTTFTTFKVANPTYWNATANIPQQRGTWLTGTTYVAGDFVIDSSRYAVCIVSHVSTTFNTDLAAGKWVVLVDLSALGVGINSTAETSIASAATMDVGAVTATRLFVTGVTTIASLGTVANIFKILRFGGALTIQHSADVFLNNNATNRITRVGDELWVTSDATGKFRELFFSRADGGPATDTERGVVELATPAEAVTGTDTVRAVTPAGVRYSTFPAGTRMVFHQTSAPTGWTKDATLNDKALRIVSGTVGSGGSVAFSTLFGRTATDNTTLTQAMLPSVNFTVSGITLNDPQHAHSIAIQQSGAQSPIAAGQSPVVLGGTSTTVAASTGITIATQGNAASGGSGTPHSHGMDMRVQYVDVIVASRD